MPESASALFPSDYFQARDRFVEAVAKAGFALQQHEVAARGPLNEVLTIDVAVLDPPAPKSTVIVSSGLHGVEGFLGSAIQCGWLEQNQKRHDPCSNTRLVFVHALNPFGFAWLRRFNEDNVDLNRNFLRSADDYYGSPPGYARFDTLLNPPSPPSRWEPFQLRSMYAIARYGLPMLKQTIAAGQYEFPKGLFYGGRGPCQSTSFVRSAMESWTAGTPRVVHLDIHSGLGRSGELQLLVEAPVIPQRRQALERHLAQPLVGCDTDDSVAYVARGSIGVDLTRRLPLHDYTYLCAEFGTHSPVRVLKALRAENRAHHWSDSRSAATRWAKSLIREAFCPQSPQWRERVYATGCRIINGAIADAESA